MLHAQKPIGVFDSGLGGLTVAHAITRHLPNESLVYLGDTARVPYGTRSAHTVVRYARGCARTLARHDIKALVVACNTVSAVALDVLRVELDVPVLGVIVPGATAGVAATRRGRLGVIATAGTVASGAYVRAVAGIDSRVEVFARPAPLLVPLAEEGWLAGEVPRRVAERYLEPFIDDRVDGLVLGCTHYPLLSDVIEDAAHRLLGENTQVVNGAQATAVALKKLLSDRDLMSEREGSLTIMVTDLPGRFSEVASRFLGRSLDGLAVEQVDL